jgi:hypothetical protein
VRLAREPGRRDARYAHLFSGEVQAASAAALPEPIEAMAVPADRLAALEQQVRELRAELQALRQAMQPAPPET